MARTFLRFFLKKGLFLKVVVSKSSKWTPYIQNKNIWHDPSRAMEVQVFPSSGKIIANFHSEK